MVNKTHVEGALQKIRAIFEEASEKIEAIPPGGKIPATALADELAKAHGMTGPQLYPTLKFLTDDYPNRVIKRGAHGGIYNPIPKEDKDAKPADDTSATTDKA